MSDARNSSNSLRGGGAKQTGGSGRTNKYAAKGTNSKTDLLGEAAGMRAHHDRSDAKRKLQLQVTSKQLALDIRTALLHDHTEAEYQAYEIPLPSTEEAKKKLQSMKDFTEKWYDQDFRDEWLQTVTEVWLEELKTNYQAAVQQAAMKQQQQGGGGEGEAMSIEELTDLIANLDPIKTAPEERQRLKKKLKRKKQRAREKEKAKHDTKEE
eukprot:CAMPEP_0170908454 /NCGR_PEP_ID=MMETSP0735-20130129/1925_1 /TAXON_ID=186038 /ORGANISM="Fragilariopsis kerguelensis, Strain L26-C5" /LENGTH=209 /DNA_ID=CAMNT_0011304801 /DNA_START=63 /DNA_END=692 /DNA_ORIENTATION=+